MRWLDRKINSIKAPIPGVEYTGDVVARISGKIEGKLVLGVHHGLWTHEPTYLQVDGGALVKVDGSVQFYGGNIIRVEPGAELHMGNGTLVNMRTSISVIKKVSIGSDCLIAAEVAIRDNDGHRLEGTEWVEPVTIGNKVWLGYRVTVLKGVTIGDGAVVAAGSVVTSDMPARSLAAGNPARVIRGDVKWSP
ncbi:MAG: DapH/DapD/GlmU-related protein [Methanobacteriota archaeon]